MESKELNEARKEYIGKRVQCIQMGEDYDPIPSEGTVIGVDDMGTLQVNWDNGRTLGVIPGVDEFKIISQHV